MHAKTAQIKIKNLEGLRPFRKSRRGMHIMPEVSFGRFMLALEKVHQAVSNGEDLNTSLSFFTNSTDKNTAKDLIAGMSGSVFKNSSWSEISQSLIFYRQGGELPGVAEDEPAAVEEEVALPGVPQEDSQEEIAEPETPVSVGEYEGLTPSQVEVVEEYKNKEYPKGQIAEKNVSMMIDKLINSYKIINDPSSSQLNINMAQEAGVEVATEFLDAYHLQALEEAKRQEVVEEVPEQKPESKKEEISISVGEPEDPQKKDSQVKKLYPSDLSEEEALGMTGINTSADYFGIEDGELTVNRQLFIEAYTQAKAKLQAWADTAITQQSYTDSKTGKYKQKYIAPSGETIRALNNIAMGIRTFDFRISSKFMEFIDEIDNAIDKSEEKTAESRLIALKRKMISQRNDILAPSLISYKLSQDSEFSEKIRESLLYVASFSAFKNVKLASEKFIHNDYSKVDKSIRNDEVASQIFIDSLEHNTYMGILSLFNNFWRLERRSLDPNTSRDLVGFMNVRSGFHFTSAVSDANAALKGNRTFNTTSCPSCHRVIEFHTGSDLNPDEQYSGYEIGLFAPYRFDETTREYTFLTEDNLRYDETGDIKYYDSPGQEYIQQVGPKPRTSGIIDLFSEDQKTWDEISLMVNSDDFSIQREGMIRRSEALRISGAYYIKTNNINSSRFLCPMGMLKRDGDSDACGVSLTKPEGATRRYQLQTGWNNQLPTITTIQNKIRKTYSNEPFQPEGWDDEKLEAAGRNLGKGGYKFSKILFGCPCHTSDIDPDDSKTYLKFNNVAFALTKGPNFQPPTQPNGTPANIEEGTMSYLVCSSNVSLSSVDRDPSSPTYILRYMNELSKTDVDLFIHLVNFLISNGFDEVDLIQMIEDISPSKSYSDMPQRSEVIDARREKRLAILEKILFEKTAVSVRSKTFDSLKNITLVCPFGHRFTIGQSLKFGESHGSFKINGSKAYKQSLNMINSSGAENAEEFMKFLIPVGDGMGLQNTAYYDEWIKLDKTKRKFNYKNTRQDKISLVTILKFDIDGVDYVFSNDTNIRQDLIWGGDSSRQFDKSSIARAIAGEAMSVSKVSRTDDSGNQKEVEFGGGLDEGSPEPTDDNEEGQRKEFNYVSDVVKREQTEWEHNMVNIMDYNVNDKHQINSPVIPGGSKEYRSAASIIGSMDALSRSLSGTLNIVNTWTTNLIHDNFGESFAREYLQDQEIRKISDFIFDNHIKSKIKFYGNEDDESYDTDIEESLRLYKDFFGSIFTDNVQISALIRKGDLEQVETGRKVVRDSIMDLIAKYENVTIPDSTEADLEDLEGFESTRLVEDIVQSSKEPSSRFSRGPKIFEEITIFNPKGGEVLHDLGKITLLAYARFMATTLFKMQTLFFTKSSPLYVGFQPLPREFDSIEDMLKVTESEVSGMTLSWGPRRSLLESPNTIYGEPGDIDNFGPKYMKMIDKAYHYLNMHVQNARNLVITPNSLEASREYLTNELGDRFIADFLNKNPEASVDEAREKAKVRQERISRAFPIYNSSFNDLVGDFEWTQVEDEKGRSYGVARYSPFNVIPYIGSGTRKKGRGDFSHPFYSQLEVETDPRTGRYVFTDSDRNYNSGELQVGFLTRPTTRTWPLPMYGFYGGNKKSDNVTKATTTNHVGFPLPFYGDYYSTKVSELKDLLVFNIRPVVNIPLAIPSDEDEGELVPTSVKIDISFLLERGFTRETYRMAYTLYAELEEVRDIRDREEERISSITTINPQKIQQKEKEIAVIDIYLKKFKGKSAYRDPVIRKERERKFLVVEKERLEEEMISTEAAKEKLVGWYEKNVSRIRQEFRGLPININTKKDLYHIQDKDAGFASLEEGGFHSQKKKMANARPASVLHVGLADPVLAYKLIMNPEFHGYGYNHIGEERIDNEEDLIQSALIDFIVGAYGLDDVARIFAKDKASVLLGENIAPESLTGRMLLEETVKGTFSKSEYGKPIQYSSMDAMPGNYYSLSVEDSSISTIANTGDISEGGVPTFSELKSATKRSKKLGLSRPYEEKSQILDLPTVSYRAADAMSRYIKNITLGDMPEEEEEEQDARDLLVSSSSRYSQKILKRAETLRRIIIMREAVLIDPKNIIG